MNSQPYFTKRPGEPKSRRENMLKPNQIHLTNKIPFSEIFDNYKFLVYVSRKARISVLGVQVDEDFALRTSHRDFVSMSQQLILPFPNFDTIYKCPVCWIIFYDCLIISCHILDSFETTVNPTKVMYINSTIFLADNNIIHYTTSHFVQIFSMSGIIKIKLNIAYNHAKILSKNTDLSLSVSRSRLLVQNNKPHEVESFVGATFSASSSTFWLIGCVSFSVIVEDDKTNYESTFQTLNKRNLRWVKFDV